MDPSVMTVSEFGNLFVQICVGLAAIGAAATYVLKVLGVLRAPEKKQNAALEDHEKRIKRLEEKTDNDFKAIQEIQTEIKIMLAATLATIKHQLNGNDTKALEQARDNLEEYLINK
jgi:thioesterase domain-containing protein